VKATVIVCASRESNFLRDTCALRFNARIRKRSFDIFVLPLAILRWKLKYKFWLASRKFHEVRYGVRQKVVLQLFLNISAITKKNSKLKLTFQDLLNFVTLQVSLLLVLFQTRDEV